MTMFKVQFDIFHKNCWGSDISLSFPQLKFSLIDTRWVKKDIAEVLLISGDSDQFSEVKDFLKKREDIVSIESISEDKENLCLRVLTKDIKEIKNFSHIFFQHDCFPVAPVKLEKGFEKWVLGTSGKENIKSVYSYLQKIHDLKVKYVKEESVKIKLTNKQMEVINYALLFGYYEWPRKKTATEISKMINIPKTVFLSHLRKAENKIIKDSLDKTS